MDVARLFWDPGIIHTTGLAPLRGAIVFRPLDGPKNRAFPYVYTPYLVLITIMVGSPVILLPVSYTHLTLPTILLV